MWSEFDSRPDERCLPSPRLRPALQRPKASSTFFENERAGAWEPVIADRIVRLRRLQTGWDGYRGQPLSMANAVIVANLLATICTQRTRTPSLVPLSSGGAQIEWHHGPIDFEITIFGPGRISAYFCDERRGDDGEELEISSDYGPLAHFVRELEQVA